MFGILKNILGPGPFVHAQAMSFKYFSSSIISNLVRNATLNSINNFLATEPISFHQMQQESKKEYREIKLDRRQK